jgi:hypothetical protein
MSSFIKLDATGEFRCKVVAPQYGWFDETAKGSKYIKLPCEVLDGEHAGKRIVWLGYLTEKAYQSTERSLAEAFGDKWTWTNIPFAGMECIIVAEEEEYNGKKQIKAKYLNSVNGIATGKSKDESLATSEKIAKALPSRGTKPTKTHDEEGDEIPF